MHFCFEHVVPVTREQVFGFFANPERLELLHGGWSRIRLLKHEIQVHVGAETWVEVSVAGFVPMVLGFQHTQFEPPTRFGEEAIHGPFSKFSHIHEFIAQDESTLVRDLLQVCLPWHSGGETGMRLVAPTIRRMFHDRAEALIRLARNGAVTSCSLQLVPPQNEI